VVNLSRALLVAFGAMLASSGCDRSPQATTGARQPPIDTEKVVNVYNWANYIDPSLLERFTTETGIKVNYDVYDSDEMLESNVLTGNTGYDVVGPTDTFLERQWKAGAYLKLNRSQIPNWTNLDTQVLEKLALHDPGNQYGVPYMWGTVGLGYNEAQVQAVMPGAPVDSWRLLLDPTIAAKFEQCGISVLNSPENLYLAVQAYRGEDLNSQTEEDLAAFKRIALGIRPYIRSIHSSNYIEALANGEICIALGWNGDVLQARDRAEEAGTGHSIRYSIPKEGSVLWITVLAIPRDAPHPQNAHTLINFLQRPDIAAGNSNYVRYANGNSASLALIDESVKNDRSIYPPPEVRSELTVAVARSDDLSRQLNRIWMRFVAGH
jgi:putrescine transport system substrate-binding protein